MDADKLRTFMKQIGELRASAPGTAMSTAGIWGAKSAQDDIVNELKRNAAAFATERSAKHPNSAKLQTLANQIEGNLQGLHFMSVINDAQFDALLDQLHNLKNT